MTDAVLQASRFPEWVVTTCGFVSLVCNGLLLAPQAWKNAQRGSTQGMSLDTMLLWHVAMVVAAAYFIGQPTTSVFITLSLLIAVFFCGLVEAQVAAYSPQSSLRCLPRWPCKLPANPRSAVAVGTTAITVLTLIVSMGLFVTFQLIHKDAAYAMGNVVPTLLLMSGFLPQIREFLVHRDLGGYSFAVTALDVVASGTGALVMLAPASLGVEEAAKQAAPFIGIIAMHAVLLLSALFVKCSRAGAATADISATGTSEGQVIGREAKALEACIEAAVAA